MILALCKLENNDLIKTFLLCQHSEDNVLVPSRRKLWKIHFPTRCNLAKYEVLLSEICFQQQQQHYSFVFKFALSFNNTIMIIGVYNILLDVYS